MMQPYGVGAYVKLNVLRQPTNDCKTKDDTQLNTMQNPSLHLMVRWSYPAKVLGE